MSSEMLSRIKRRNQRPTVERDTSLVQSTETTQPTSLSATADLAEQSSAAMPAVQPSEKETVRSPNETAPAQSAAAGATAIEVELAALPQVSQRRNIRLEVELEGRLLSFCQQNEITVETFLEACFVEAEQNTQFRTELVAEAERRLKQRKQAGKLRRVLSQLKK